jgi:hypothetical protein
LTVKEIKNAIAFSRKDGDVRYAREQATPTHKSRKFRKGYAVLAGYTNINYNIKMLR